MARFDSFSPRGTDEVASAGTYGHLTPLARFRAAVAATEDEYQFQHVPVDWWDQEREVWRPSVIEHVLPTTSTRRTTAIIAAPLWEDCGMARIGLDVRRVAISDLRPSQLVTDRIARFFSTRYTLSMLDSLQPCIEHVSQQERGQLQAVLDDLHRVYEETYHAWRTAYLEGSRDDDADDSVTLTWRARALDENRLPSHHRADSREVDVFTALNDVQTDGEVSYSPVALWDESALRWRPTIMLGATGDDNDFAPRSRVRVLVPGTPLDVITVSGAVLEPLDIVETCFSLFAIPVLARDVLRMHEALRSAGLNTAEVAANPQMIALTTMLVGAAEEWTTTYDEGMDGPAPEPRVVPLAPNLWGFTADRTTVAPDERR